MTSSDNSPFTNEVPKSVETHNGLQHAVITTTSELKIVSIEERVPSIDSAEQNILYSTPLCNPPNSIATYDDATSDDTPCKLI